MDWEQVATWVAAYERAWRTPGTETLGEIFAADATYVQGPYEEPVRGLPAIARMWEAGRDGADEVFEMSSSIVAVDGPTAVARVEVRYGEPVEQEYRDLWIMSFTGNGLCQGFEEWAYWPGQPYTARP